MFGLKLELTPIVAANHNSHVNTVKSADFIKSKKNGKKFLLVLEGGALIAYNGEVLFLLFIFTVDEQLFMDEVDDVPSALCPSDSFTLSWLL